MFADKVVKLANSKGLSVVSRGVSHFSVPKGIVGQDERSELQPGHEQLQITYVFALICVDENQIPGTGKLLNQLGGVAYVEVDSGVMGGKKLTQLRLLFIVMLHGVEFPTLGQTFGQAKRGIAGKRAQFKDAAGANHVAEHREQPPLEMARTLARIEMIELRLAVESLQMLRLRLNVA